MARIVGIGKQDFEKIRVNNNFYIDKTDFIREWWEADDDVTLITRPRRFGKTLNMSMVKEFFSVTYAGRAELFEGLSIWEEKTPDGNYGYRRQQGTWPVISFSFANVKEKKFDTARGKICQILSDLYSENRFLLKEGILDDKEKKFFRNVGTGMDDVTATLAVHQLCSYLSRYYGKKVILLLDEYDTPMQEAYLNGYWEEMAAFIRSLLNASFKTNPCLERALMTGITRIGRESIFSDLNNLEVVTTTSDKYAECFGFTEEEVFAALEEYDLAAKREEVKQWYDGFTFGTCTDIYNPWSILNYLDKGKVGAYWANSSSNSLVGKLIREGSAEIKMTMEGLLRGEIFHTTFDEQMVFEQLEQGDDGVWDLLLAGGYLKIVHHGFHAGRRRMEYDLALTNMEVQVMFERMIESWFGGCRRVTQAFLQALVADDVKAMNAYMNKVALQTFSYFDTGKNPSEEEPERFYHGFVLGMMVEMAEQYTITSNRESGFGRYDVVLEPKEDDAFAVIMEFKVQDGEEKDLTDTAREALRQIEEKDYQAGLLAKGIAKERIRKYGFAFRGKTVLIEAG